MLYFLGEYLEPVFGPFRLFTSHLFLAGVGLVLCWLLSWWLLSRFSQKLPHDRDRSPEKESDATVDKPTKGRLLSRLSRFSQNFLPRDRGRSFAVESAAAVGKPTGAGIIFVSLFIIVQILVIPFSLQFLVILGCILLAMIFGFWDDQSRLAWGEYKKGAIDLMLAIIVAATMCQFDNFKMWLPFTKIIIHVPPSIFIPLATILIWTAINATNCTDGVDGLSGTLTAVALITLGGLLYFVVGHKEIAAYLLLPHYVEGAKWAIMAFSMVGSLAGYLWFNAHPSTMLMGDAGSRALGLLIGVLVISTGNPLIIFIVAGVLLVNGGTGLIKVALLRFFKIGIFHNVRFPLHDHFRHNAGWSNTQVLLRFTLLQAMMTLILIVILLKIR